MRRGPGPPMASLPLSTRVLPVAILLGGASLAAPAERWVEVRSPHFVVVSNASEGTVRGTAWQFEQMREALAKVWPWARFGGPGSVLVAAVKDESSLRKLTPRYWEEKDGIRPVSVWVDGPDRHYVMLRTDAGMRQAISVNPYFNVFRAYVHIVLDTSLEQRLPVWLEVALGEYYGNLAVRDDEIQLGRAIPWHIEEVRRGERLNLADLLAVDRRSPLYRRDDRRALLSAEAWGFFHFLTFAEKGRYVPQINRYVNLSLAGDSDGARQALGDLGQLQAQYRRYFDAPTLNFGRLQVQAAIEREKFPVRALAAGEVAAGKAAIHVAMKRPLEASAQVEAAKQAAPESPLSWDAEGLLWDLKDDREKAGAAYGRAIALGSQSEHTYYRSAQLAWKAEADDAAWREIAATLERALTLAPASARVHSYLSDARVRLKQPAEAEPLARRAIELEPGRTYHRIALARALNALGRKQEALAEARRGLALADSDQERAYAQEMLEYLRRSPG